MDGLFPPASPTGTHRITLSSTDRDHTVASWLAELQGLFAQTFGLDVEAYTSLTTIEEEDCFVTKDGGLMSLMQLRGHLRVVGVEELDRLTGALEALLGTIVGGGPAHILDVAFTSDPAATPAEIRRLLKRSGDTARRQGLDLRDVLAERERHLPTYTCAETVYLTLWTTPAGLPPATRRRAQSEQRQEAERFPALGLTRDQQNPFASNRYLVDAHRSVVKTLINDLAHLGFELAVLPVTTACRAIRAEVDPEWTPAEWTPVLPGAPWPAPRERPEGILDAAGCWFPAFGAQLIPRGMEILDDRTVRVGDRLYQPFYVDLPQLTEVQRFERQLQRVRAAQLPWRLLIRLRGGAADWLRSRHRWAGLLNFASHQNRLIDAAVVALSRFLNEGHLGVLVQMALTTWVRLTETTSLDPTPLAVLRTRTAQLAAHLQAWGSCTVREAAGHPVKALVSTAPGLTQLNIATRYAAPLADVLKTLPLFRAASPWLTGAVIYRTRDGQLFPYQPGSALQGTWNELYFARPGSGKSVAMNLNNLGLILSPGFRQLPYVRVVDVGPSSEGLISLVREALPRARRYEAQFHAPQNHANWAINPLDTPLGFRQPLPQDRAFLVSFLSVLATSPGESDPPEGVADLAGLVIDLAYQHYSDAHAPKRYAFAQDAQVDRALQQHAIALPDQPSWWEVVDALFEAGDAPAAIRAQRYAAPLLSDLNAIAPWPQVMALYGDALSLQRTGESPVALFTRVIAAATREWPLLAYPTRFDLGNARVASLDLAALCGDMTPVGQRQTAIAFLLARHVLGRDLFLDDQTPGWAPVRYRAWHRDRVEALLAYPKKFCIDEKHRCGRFHAVDGQIVRDMREGRKSHVHIALASQILEDFTDEMAELATAIYIMEYASDDQAEALRTKFSLSASALAELRLHGTGPTPAGAPFLCVLRTKRGLITQLLYLTTGPIELWALSTTAEDRLVRARLYQRFTPQVARAALAQAYPGGSIKAELQRRLEHSGEENLDQEAVLAALVEEVAAIAMRGCAPGGCAEGVNRAETQGV